MIRRAPERRQQALLPADIMERLPENDIVHLIVEAVGMMDLSKFEAGYRLGRAGQAPFAPQLRLALLIYTYSQGVGSSRRSNGFAGATLGITSLWATTSPTTP